MSCQAMKGSLLDVFELLLMKASKSVKIFLLQEFRRIMWGKGEREKLAEVSKAITYLS